MAQSNEAWIMYRVRKTAVQLCHDRGYYVSQDELDESFEDFLAKFSAPDETIKRSELSIFVTKDSGTDTLLVSFADEEKIGTGFLKNTMGQLEKEKCKHCIIISKGALTPSAKQFISQDSNDVRFEHFLDRELVINVTEHELVPVHVVLSEEEKQSVLSKYMVRENQLPRMLTSDPVARYFGLQRGVLVRIIRNSETAGRYVTYRLVV
ncbi:hypothetical protein ACOME3_001181 [Neoechinorhynchus agilis]